MQTRPLCSGVVWLTTAFLIFPQLTVGQYGRTDDSSGDEKRSLLERDGFEMFARVRVSGRNSDHIYHEAITREFYSIKSRRARLDMDSKNVRYYYNNINRLIKSKNYTANEAGCEPVNEGNLTADLFGTASLDVPELRYTSWFAKLDGVPEYAIGLTRLLFIIDENRDKLKLDSRPAITQHRNRDVDSYSYKVDLGTGVQSKMKIYVDKGCDFLRSIEMPLRIWIELASGAELVAEFYYLKPIQSDNKWRQSTDVVDMFTLPLGIGCSSKLKPTLDSKLVSQFNDHRVASFHVVTQKMIPPGMYLTLDQYFVSYDGFAQAMRTDSMIHPMMNDPRKSWGEYKIAVHDLLLNRKYTITHRLDKNSLQNKEKVIDILKGQAECYATYLPTDRTDNYDAAYEPIIPFGRLVEMGTATIRGVETRAFEVVSKSLPKLLFPHVTIRNSNGSTIFTYDDDEASSDLDYKLVYYISTNSGGQLVHLMRVDAWTPLSHYIAEVFDFIWQLTAAPNGDHQEELFALRDRCTNSYDQGRLSSQTEKPAQLSLELLYTEAPQYSYLNLANLVKLLNGSAVRNKAIVRSISQSSNFISASQIFNLKSRMRHENDVSTLKILVDLELARVRPKLYQPISLGKGFPRSDAYWMGDIWLVTRRATTFERCLDKAVEIRSKFEAVIFSYCQMKCLIDVEATLNYSEANGSQATLVDSKVFTLAKDGECNILYLKVEDDSELIGRTKSWSYVYFRLHSKLLTLPLVDSKGLSAINQVPMKLLFKVNSLILNNIKWWRDRYATNQSTIGVHLAADDEALRGLGLTTHVGDSIILESNSRDSDLSSTIDASSCRASCIARLNCRSYSLCMKDQKVECMISSLDFRNSSLLNKMKTGLAELKSKTVRRGTFSLDWKIEKGNKSDQIELKVDRRCQIHNKRALETFRQLPKSTGALVDKNLLPAVDEEECAELCLQRNAKFFSRMNRWRATSSQSLTNQSEDGNQTAKLMDDMRHWCAMFKFFNLGAETLSTTVLSAMGLDKVGKGGVCSLARPRWAPRTILANSEQRKQENSTDSAKKSVPVIKMETFEFLYSTLYQRQNGLRLLGSLAQPVDLTKVEINHQKVEEQSDIELCARSCFSQTVQLSPWCRSFDYLQIETANPKTKALEFSYYCVYNSMTMTDLMKLDGKDLVLLADGAHDTDPTKFWHYEPRQTYALDNVVLQTLSREQEGNFRLDSNEFRWGLFGTTLISIAAIASGLTVSLTYWSRLGLIERQCGGVLDRIRTSLGLPSNNLINNDHLQNVHEANGGL